MADDLQVPEEAVVHILAILQVAAARGHRLAAQFCTCRGQCAMRPPFLVLLLLIWPEGLAHRVGRNIESLHLVDAMQVHAPLHEEVFAPWLHAGCFLGAFPVQADTQSSRFARKLLNPWWLMTSRVGIDLHSPKTGCIN